MRDADGRMEPRRAALAPLIGRALPLAPTLSALAHATGKDSKMLHGCVICGHAHRK